jgi:hypothetical protein
MLAALVFSSALTMVPPPADAGPMSRAVRTFKRTQNQILRAARVHGARVGGMGWQPGDLIGAGDFSGFYSIQRLCALSEEDQSRLVMTQAQPDAPWQRIVTTRSLQRQWGVALERAGVGGRVQRQRVRVEGLEVEFRRVARQRVQQPMLAQQALERVPVCMRALELMPGMAFMVSDVDVFEYRVSIDVDQAGQIDVSVLARNLLEALPPKPSDADDDPTQGFRVGISGSGSRQERIQIEGVFDALTLQTYLLGPRPVMPTPASPESGAGGLRPPAPEGGEDGDWPGWEEPEWPTWED